jgi:hypothetical protein
MKKRSNWLFLDRLERFFMKFSSNLHELPGAVLLWWILLDAIGLPAMLAKKEGTIFCDRREQKIEKNCDFEANSEIFDAILTKIWL